MKAKKFLEKITPSPFTISTDTRSIRKGDVFIALKGKTFDANDFVNQALNAGAVWVVCENSDFVNHPNKIKMGSKLR